MFIKIICSQENQNNVIENHNFIDMYADEMQALNKDLEKAKSAINRVQLCRSICLPACNLLICCGFIYLIIYFCIK